MPDPAVTRHHEILDAAVDDMVTHGAHATKIDRVARAAGVAKGTVYLYFASRDALVHAALDRGLILDELGDLAHDPTPVTRATWPAQAAALWTALEERAEVVRILARDGLGLLDGATHATLASLLDAYAARWRAPSPAYAARMALFALVAHHLAGGDLTPDAVAAWGSGLTA